MSEILRAVGVMTVAGSALAVCLFALRPWLKNRLPKSVQYYLWLVVIAALLVPVSRIVTLPVVINPVNSLKAVTGRTEYTLTPPQALAAALDSIGDAADGGLGTITVPAGTSRDGALETTELFHSQAWFALGSYVYPVGVLAVLMYLVIGNNVFLRRLRRRNVPAGIECRVPVYRNPLASTPMLIGVFRPAIVLPDKEYTDEQLEAVLRHELTHLHRRDILVRWLSVLACAVHWFNPIVWLTRREIDRACELSCDEAVIRGLDTDGKQNYGDTLLYVAASVKTPRAVLSTTMCEDKKDLKERLGAIMKNRKYTKLAVLASAALITAAILAACALGAGSESGNGYANFEVTQTRSDPPANAADTIGIIPDGIDVPDAVLAAAADWVRSDYEGSRDTGLSDQRERGAEFDNWRLDYIEHAYSYSDMGIEVYRFEWRVHTTTPDKIQPAGGEEIDDGGWFLDTYPESWYLFFDDADGELTYLFAMMENDCGPGDEMFTQDILRRLDALSRPEDAPIPEREPPLDVSLLTGDQVQSVRAVRLPRSWQTVMPSGETVTLMADSPHPLHLKDYPSVTLELNNESGRIALRWEAYPPQTVTVQRWDAIYEGTKDIDVWYAGEQISLEGHSFVIDDDGNDYIYEVYAAWPEGDSGYAFRVDSVGKKSVPDADYTRRGQPTP